VRTEIQMELRFTGARVASSIYSAVIPDNVGVPSCMKLRMSRRGRTILILIHSMCDIDTLISTTDDLLESCELSLASLAG
jgi:tRNA threonylcarbamoyladenosine modification (KEOPS) complex  Pcc1 subunit